MRRAVPGKKEHNTIEIKKKKIKNTKAVLFIQQFSWFAEEQLSETIKSPDNRFLLSPTSVPELSFLHINPEIPDATWHSAFHTR